MSIDLFLRLLQTLITLVQDPNDEESVEMAEAVLKYAWKLVERDGRYGRGLYILMTNAIRQFRMLLDHRDSYAGVPGANLNNQMKRRRLEMALNPHC